MDKLTHITLTQLQRRWLWGFLALAGILRLVMLFEIPFTDTTEARYAEIARKMVETGDWMTPQFDYGVPFWGKPPLHTWVSALGMKLFGVGQFGARIFIFLTAIATVWMLYAWARSYKGRDYALAGIVILSSTALFYLASATVMTDLVMASGVFLSMAGFYVAVTGHKHARLWSYLFFVGLGIGMLAKGPVAVVLTGIPIGMWVLLKNRWRDTWRQLPWIEGSLLSACIFLPWYVGAEIKTPGFIEYFILGEHWHRFLDSGWTGDLYGHGHAETRGTIWVFWLAAVLPWSFFFLAPLRWGRRVYRGLVIEADGWSLYLLCWALSPMLFFTLATNIIATYVITGLPAACFLVIDLWRFAGEGVQVPKPGVARFYVATVSVAVCLFALVCGAVYVGGASVVKKSQKYLIEDINQMRGTSGGQIYYLDKRYYSAEFYAEGQVHTIESIDGIETILHNDARDFLVIRKSRMDQLPADFDTKFKLQGIYAKDALYYEL
ncbi:glycosyltransferase family 39 protein [Coraliomargarita algicola]|uniref:Glycosyltransferase family 39 protein n=1 Tax=Coraliomargarita algicola TaxID=3092156 RepID=A0ABZ0RRU1_9BACT|nr:glycosyltransferase family 39 protein [Coraliomargarita sp. J2-16]WPJ97705.1 glycosyltransferase family 39 protein [Coraliomargarita sp. J2-16]